jgi:hypothetical protein
MDEVSGHAAEVQRPLTGGRLTTGVVQVGDTVRRPASAASRFVARLLTCLAENGFDGCPLGRDEQGRDVLSFLPGEVPARWRRFHDAQVGAAAAMLRRMHDATRELAAEIGSGEVICHHDPGPNNTVFHQGQPVAFIDFDFAAPGQSIEDLAYMAWSWCLSSRAPQASPSREGATHTHTNSARTAGTGSRLGVHRHWSSTAGFSCVGLTAGALLALTSA